MSSVKVGGIIHDGDYLKVELIREITVIVKISNNASQVYSSPIRNASSSRGSLSPSIIRASNNGGSTTGL